MTLASRDAFRTLLVLALAGSPACQAGRQPASPPDAVDRFVLEIERDGSLSLDGKKTARPDLARGFARLADKSRSRAKDAGKPLDPKRALPATIVFWADDRTTFATLFPLFREMQASGFRLFGFARKSVYPDAATLRARPRDVMPPLERESGLPETIRTLPIELHADDRGQIAAIELGEHLYADLEALGRQVREIQNDPETPFDRAVLRVDPRLTFSELVQVVNLLVSSKVESVAFGLMEIESVP
jgi:biopolymer transport protein ExbD